MTVFVVMRFDPMQCGACGNGALDKIFSMKRDAETYIEQSNRRGVGWEIKECQIESHNEEVPAAV